jgi:hypothetical protein
MGFRRQIHQIPYGFAIRGRDKMRMLVGRNRDARLMENGWVEPHEEMVEQRAMVAPRQTWRRLIHLALILVLAGVAFGVAIWPVAAAIELRYFFVDVTPRDVTLKWATNAEYDLSGFEVLCKVEGQLDSEYHPIGEVLAEGSPQQGAAYIFPITRGLQPGVRYCFALREISIGGEAGDFFERCGYGLGIRPALTARTILTDSATLRALEITGTAIALDLEATLQAAAIETYESLLATAAITATPTLTTVLQLAPTLTAIALISPTLTAIAQLPPTPELVDGLLPVSVTLTALSVDYGATQTAIVAISQGLPVDTPTPPSEVTPMQPFEVTLTALSIEMAATETALFITGSSLPEETPTPTQIGDSPLFPPGLATQDPFAPPAPGTDPNDPNAPQGQGDPNLEGQPPTDDPNSQFEPATATPTETTSSGVLAPLPPVAEPPLDEQALAAATTPDPPYIVLTATPATPTTPVPPTLTPLPVATPTLTGFNLASFVVPTTQNLTLMLLCLTFFAASGLGILGLISSVLYMRSQRDRRDDEDQQLW